MKCLGQGDAVLSADTTSPFTASVLHYLPIPNLESRISSTMANSSSRAPQLERGKACLRCRRRKMRCDGARPTCNQCERAGVVDCEYTDEGPTVSQVLEQNVTILEARIRALEGDAASVTLHNPHAAHPHNQPAGQATGPGSPQLNSSQKIIQSFVNVAPDFGFFLHLPRFLAQLRASMPPTDQSPLPATLVHAAQLVGLLFCGDDALKQQAPRKLAAVLQTLSADMDPTRIVYTLQAEVLVSHYLFHQNRRLEGSYHAAAAVSIAVACNLHKTRSAAWLVAPSGSPSGQEVQLFPPTDDIEEGERIRAFWTVFALDRCWSVWTRSSSVFMMPATAMTQVDTPWPLEMVEYEQHLMMPQGSTSALTVQNFLDGLSTELPDQSLLSLLTKSAVLFEQAYHLAEQWNPSSMAFQNEFHTLDGRVDSFRAVVAACAAGPRQRTAALQRGLLLVRTLLCCATIQLYARTGPRWDCEDSKILRAAVAAAEALDELDLVQSTHVDPVLGMLWAMVCQTFVTALSALRSASTSALSPAVSVSAGEIVVINSLNRVLGAMEALKDANPVVAAELATLHTVVATHQAGILI
ncbi:uncharacterized protein PHACADRAFT_213827 [Phanerochaete carnosa HHB-10118-sp]|uniref:Zn(2)-C6 fungal-type domain-containing protein n=1 Tax=Phanerochaete carnosa (strain HHB-10118-sp) TaxID=650164 RepID=K5WIJ2_PHACS|nr:uncharacterized protein PHACADRAFT_213827 [Phanerochaete carnosa HHB-10118-sp]EKM50062.1 hypothetical protein PHACADRAFT_213827 [Phanerochaete carnosa HHB-10118-sp]